VTDDALEIDDAAVTITKVSGAYELLIESDSLEHDIVVYSSVDPLWEQLVSEGVIDP